MTLMLSTLERLWMGDKKKHFLRKSNFDARILRKLECPKGRNQIIDCGTVKSVYWIRIDE